MMDGYYLKKYLANTGIQFKMLMFFTKFKLYYFFVLIIGTTVA